MGLYNETQRDSFQKLTAFFKSEGSACKIGIQLAHGGRKASSQKAPDGMGPLTKEQIEKGAKHWTPVGPTATPTADGWLTPHALTTEECEEMGKKWAHSAKLAVSAGFDTIECHMAHG
jgi:2,4-dienoyl-CoA reductase-like NADH-dependent reductase (Old Yellow Enzyme family)